MPPLSRVKYSIKLLITNLLPVLLLILCVVITGGLGHYLKAIIAFCLLRQVSGGYHIKNAELCVVASTGIIYFIANYSYLFVGYDSLIKAGSLILCLLFSPSGIKDSTRVDSKYHIAYKLISVLLIVSSYLINDITINLAFFVQSLLLIRLKGGEKSYEK